MTADTLREISKKLLDEAAAQTNYSRSSVGTDSERAERHIAVASALKIVAQVILEAVEAEKKEGIETKGV